jgi:hypothetical protein
MTTRWRQRKGKRKENELTAGVEFSGVKGDQEVPRENLNKILEAKKLY